MDFMDTMDEKILSYPTGTCLLLGPGHLGLNSQAILCRAFGTVDIRMGVSGNSDGWIEDNAVGRNMCLTAATGGTYCNLMEV